MDTVRDPQVIKDWHAHIYYTPATREQAAQLRTWLGARFPEAVLGRWHEEKVGPHPQAMYQVLFPVASYPGIVPFIALNRHGLTVLIHPNTGRDRDDHTLHASWMGAVLPVDVSMLSEGPG